MPARHPGRQRALLVSGTAAAGAACVSILGIRVIDQDAAVFVTVTRFNILFLQETL